jgi:hypothetical protein
MNLPPETILSNTSEIISACEMAEVSVDPAQNATAEGVESPPPTYILVCYTLYTQWAANACDATCY